MTTAHTVRRHARIHNPAELAVSEKAGTVTLRGTVRSLHQRRTAVEIARSVRGVRAVEEDLRVDPRDHWRDEVLRGAVKHRSDSDAAFAAVSRLAGVGGITNEIKVITAGLGG
jgi:osmotically-inducible protein OsmY